MPVKAPSHSPCSAQQPHILASSSGLSWSKRGSSFDKQHDNSRDSLRAAQSLVCARRLSWPRVLGDARRSILGPSGMNVVRACHEIITSPESAHFMVSSFPEFASISARMYGPREDRVVAFV